MCVQGSLSARGERILFLDADGATEVTDIERLEKALDEVASDHVSSTIQSCVLLVLCLVSPLDPASCGCRI